MKILLAGAGGMLGGAFGRAIPIDHPGIELVRLGRERLDPRRPDALLRAVIDAAPALVINAAAHTDVEGAEGDPEPAFLANAELPALLGLACRRTGAGLIHISSTGCYGAWQEAAYDEHDRVEPTTVHHRSKVAGEAMVRESGAEHLIVRTGWLFGGDPGLPKNFVFRRIQEASRGPDMQSDPTQTGCPTWVEPLARQIDVAWAAGMRGTCNIVSHGSASRLDYVREIVRLSGLPCAVSPSAGGFARRARVSPNEAAVNRRLGRLGLDRMTDWREQLARYVEELRATPAWTSIEAAARERSA